LAPRPFVFLYLSEQLAGLDLGAHANVGGIADQLLVLGLAGVGLLLNLADAEVGELGL
jgi:hypothetical protein